MSTNMRSPNRCGMVAKPWLALAGSLALAAALVALLVKPAAQRSDSGELMLFCAAGLLKPVEEILSAIRRGVRRASADRA